MDQAKAEKLIGRFVCEGELEECIPFGSGHINETYRVTLGGQDGSTRYILQGMNTVAFKHPEELMHNIAGVTEWIKQKVQENGGDPQRETLSIVETRDGKTYFEDEECGCWRMFTFVEHATCYDQVKCDNDFYQSAVAFGRFQRMLADYPAQELYETIKDFHNTPARYAQFQAALAADAMGRAAGVQKEIQFVQAHEPFTHELTDRQARGELPLRVTHNDTKLNNIMIDDETGKALCVIDLDTVMPGLSVNDFGDSIRFGASTAMEDEQDLDKVSMDLHLYEVYVKGFIEGCAGALTEGELDALPIGAMMMTLECGMRFLTDYLEGDHYFHIQRENQNLDRCRTQFKLVQDMEEKLPQMREIVNRYRA